MTKWMLWLMTTLMVTIGGPLVALAVDPDGAMLICMFLFFVLNPLCALYSGLLAGQNIKKQWYLPLITVALFIIGAWWLLSMDVQGLYVYSPIYLVVSVIAMSVTAAIKAYKKNV